MIKCGIPPYLECSSRGNKAFSAFYARLKAYGNKSIEEIALTMNRTVPQIRGKALSLVREGRIAAQPRQAVVAQRKLDRKYRQILMAYYPYSKLVTI